MARRTLAILTLTLLLGTGGRSQDPKKDLEALQGVWQAVNIVGNGNVVPADEVKAVSMEFKGSKMYFREGKQVTAMSVKLDAAAKPRTIDLVVEDGPEKGAKFLGIYEIESDSLKLCHHERSRPKEFVSPAVSDVSLVVLKRVKK